MRAVRYHKKTYRPIYIGRPTSGYKTVNPGVDDQEWNANITLKTRIKGHLQRFYLQLFTETMLYSRS